MSIIPIGGWISMLIQVLTGMNEKTPDYETIIQWITTLIAELLAYPGEPCDGWISDLQMAKQALTAKPIDADEARSILVTVLQEMQQYSEEQTRRSPMGEKEAPTEKHPLNLPKGSVRAILAIGVLLVMAVLFIVPAFWAVPDVELFRQGQTGASVLLTAVIGWYFQTRQSTNGST